MSKALGRFLHETGQLFYWSLFSPSKLQQRMNEWSHKKAEKEIIRNTNSWDILLFEINSKFTLQYLLVSVVLSLPLACFIDSLGWGWNSLLLLAAPLISYVLGVWFMPSGIGFCSLLLLAVMYWQQAALFTKAFQFLFKITPSLPPFFTGVYTGTLILVITIFTFWILRKMQALFPNDESIWVSSSLSILIGSWIATHNLSVAMSIAIPASFITFLMGDSLYSAKDFVVKSIVESITASIAAIILISIVAFGIEIMLAFLLEFITRTTTGILAFLVAFSMAFYMVLIVAFLVISNMLLVVESIVEIFVVIVAVLAASIIVAMFTAIFVASITIAPLPWFLFDSALLAFGCAPFRDKSLGLLIAIVIVTLGWENLGLQALWVVPVSLIFYYRIFPDYLVAYLISLISVLLEWFAISPSNIVTKNPPYTTELLWLPLPHHPQILAATFRKNTVLGLTTLQEMLAIPLPGFQITVKNALPLIMADRFAAVKTTLGLIDSFTPANPIIPLLILAFYQSDQENTSSLAIPKSGKPEIDFLLPVFRQIAKDTSAALQAGSSALRERGLERLVDKLKILPTHLPGLGLNPQSAQRWQPAITCWQHILELEIAEQQKVSQGELLNPFQFGNPLRPNSATIFKGRQAFADQLVRLILDRNRPTLVLHGPRRAGKTSFLLNLPRLLPSDLIPVYLDIQQNSMTDSEGDFCYGFVRAIHRDTLSQGLQIPSLPNREDFIIKPYSTLEDWLEGALSKLGERRLLLNLDEFEKIGSAIKEQRISDRLFDQLRSMIQHDDRLGFLFSGVQTLEELGPRWSNYFISVVPMEMHYLEPTEAEDLLLNPDPEFTLRYAPGIVDEILTLTRCQPYLLQLIGFALVTEANRQQTQTATTELLQSAIQSAFTNGEPYFTNIWTEFTGTTPSEVAAGQNLLLALARGNSQSPIICDEATTAASRRLIRYHVIERINENIDINASGDSLPETLRERQASQYENRTNMTWEPAHHHIEIPLFEQWVKERAIKI
jgi:hypothetical protein